MIRAICFSALAGKCLSGYLSPEVINGKFWFKRIKRKKSFYIYGTKRVSVTSQTIKEGSSHLSSVIDFPEKYQMMISHLRIHGIPKFPK